MTTAPPQSGQPAAAEAPRFNITFKMRHCNGMSTLKDHLGFVFPSDYGAGVGTVQQQRHGWIAFQMPIAATSRRAAADIGIALSREVFEQWTLPPHLPPEEKLREIHLDPGIGNETLPWDGMRLVSCNLCHAAAGADTADDGRAWMLAHPDGHTPDQRARLGEGVQHYTLRWPSTADRKAKGL